MRKKIAYTNEPLGEIEVVRDFLPPPAELAFREEGERPDGTTSTRDQAQASNAKDLLDRLSRLPGVDEIDSFNYEHFRSWIETVRSLATDGKRLKVCDYTLGEIFARATFSELEDWPPQAVARLMEEINTDELFRGFATAVMTGRELFQASSWGGSVQERARATRCRELAEINRPFSPKLSKMFINIADWYDEHARQDDEDAEREKLGR